MSFYDLPSGIFNTLLALWETIVETFIEVVSFCSQATIAMGDNEFNFFVIFFGGGLTVYFTFVIGRWLKQLFLT